MSPRELRQPAKDPRRRKERKTTVYISIITGLANNMRITLISDTHGKHAEIKKDLPGGDLIIHAGDLTSTGYLHEITSFCYWFNSLNQYYTKIFIAGNHDFLFENQPSVCSHIVNEYERLLYLQDSYVTVQTTDGPILKIYGTPWQPEFKHWAFNLPRGGSELERVWNDIPEDTDILITHAPPFGTLDRISKDSEELGCNLLRKRIPEIKPKIHVFGHIHGGNGYSFDGHTHYFNASVLNEKYRYTNKPVTFDWDPIKNSIDFVND